MLKIAITILAGVWLRLGDLFEKDPIADVDAPIDFVVNFAEQINSIIREISQPWNTMPLVDGLKKNKKTALLDPEDPADDGMQVHLGSIFRFFLYSVLSAHDPNASTLKIVQIANNIFVKHTKIKSVYIIQPQEFEDIFNKVLTKDNGALFRSLNDHGFGMTRKFFDFQTIVVNPTTFLPVNLDAPQLPQSNRRKKRIIVSQLDEEQLRRSEALELIHNFIV